MNLNNIELNEKLDIGRVVELLGNYALVGNVLFITSKSFSERGVIASCQARLTRCNVLLFDRVDPNPEVSQLRCLTDKYYHSEVNTIVALGGGSVIDTAKVLSLWLAAKQIGFEPLLSLDAREIQKIPLIAIPTTAGTGAEVTPFATVWDSEKQKKYSVSDVKPSRVILDAELTLTLPQQETLYSALDALSHSLESIWNTNRTDDSLRYAESAINLICAALPNVLARPDDIQAREQLQIAATKAGQAISITKTAIAHAISYPLTLKYSIPHGLACSVTLQSIINQYGHQKLNLCPILADKVTKLLQSLRLAKEVNKFVKWPVLLNQFESKLDPSRAGNFILPVSENTAFQLLVNSGGLTDKDDR